MRNGRIRRPVTGVAHAYPSRLVGANRFRSPFDMLGTTYSEEQVATAPEVDPDPCYLYGSDVVGHVYRRIGVVVFEMWRRMTLGDGVGMATSSPTLPGSRRSTSHWVRTDPLYHKGPQL